MFDRWYWFDGPLHISIGVKLNEVNRKMAISVKVPMVAGAAKYMPVSSIIVGIDMLPIKPIY